MAKDTVPMQLIDKRVVERNIKKGLVTREMFEKHLSSLHDVASQAELIQAKLGVDEDEAASEQVDDESGDDDAGSGVPEENG